MPTVQELIESNKQLLKDFPSKASRKQRNGTSDDVFIYQNRPVKDTNWREKPRDVVFVNVYFPTKVPSFDFAKSVVLHKHTIFEQCTRDRYCHMVGYMVEDRHRSEFDIVWGYLYYPEVSPVVHVRLNLDFGA